MSVEQYKLTGERLVRTFAALSFAAALGCSAPRAQSQEEKASCPAVLQTGQAGSTPVDQAISVNSLNGKEITVCGLERAVAVFNNVIDLVLDKEWFMGQISYERVQQISPLAAATKYPQVYVPGADYIRYYEIAGDKDGKNGGLLRAWDIDQGKKVRFQWALNSKMKTAEDDALLSMPITTDDDDEPDMPAALDGSDLIPVKIAFTLNNQGEVVGEIAIKLVPNLDLWKGIYNEDFLKRLRSWPKPAGGKFSEEVVFGDGTGVIFERNPYGNQFIDELDIIIPSARKYMNMPWFPPY